MLTEFSFLIDYAQVLVYTQSHPKPGLLWNDDHVAQGFAWADGVVSFGVPDHDGLCHAQVWLSDSADLDATSLWAVQVPFSVSEPVQIGSVFETLPVDVPRGEYNLIFEALPGDEKYAYRFRIRFLAAAVPDFAILRQGGELATDTVLARDAELAG